MRKAKNVSSVMGWELNRQLSEPGAACCDSMSILVEVARKSPMGR